MKKRQVIEEADNCTEISQREQDMKDQQMIEEAFQDLMETLREETTEENRQLIRRAFELANEAHRGVKRKSLLPYMMHPIAVAKIVSSEIGLGTTSVVTALLHDVVEDADYTVEDIANLFGPKVASLVDGLTKIDDTSGAKINKQMASFRKIILALVDDVRVILIKIADRLHNMRTLDAMLEHKQVKTAGETLFIYAPLAYRMGLHAIKTELEDLSLKYEHPEEYNQLHQKIQQYQSEHSDIFERFTAPICQRLQDNGYQFEIAARMKSVYSVWSKMQRQNISFEDVYDILAVRIVFTPKMDQPEAWQCWHIYWLITGLYTSNTDRIRDWVGAPKANGYEALHLTVMGPSGRWVEVQIRSQRMDEIAEKGVAAHWKYKGDTEFNAELDKWLADIKEVLEHANENDLSSLMDDIRGFFYAKEVRVFTPKGDMKKLPKGSSVLDFAYDIHTEIGNTCIGGKVNHKLEPMSYVLHYGDQVEILTSDAQQPTSDWLQYVVTTKAKNNIDIACREERKGLIRHGSSLFKGLLKEMNLTSKPEALRKALLHLELDQKEDLYFAMAKGKLSLDEVKKALKRKSSNKFVEYWKLQFSRSDKEKDNAVEKKGEKPKKNPKIKEPTEEDQVIIAQDCSPIPGDDVVGLRMEGGKIVVHKRKCPEAIRLMSQQGDQIVPGKWVSHKIMSFLAVIKLNGIDSIGMVSDITQVISKENNVNMRSLHFDTKDGIFEGVIHLYVHNVADLNNLMVKIASLKGIENVSRVENIDN